MNEKLSFGGDDHKGYGPGRTGYGLNTSSSTGVALSVSTFEAIATEGRFHWSQSVVGHVPVSVVSTRFTSFVSVASGAVDVIDAAQHHDLRGVVVKTGGIAGSLAGAALGAKAVGGAGAAFGSVFGPGGSLVLGGLGAFLGV